MKCEDFKVYFNPADKKWHIDAVLASESIAKGKTLSDNFAGKNIDISLKKFSQKRSISANAYYWTLLSKLASAMRVSKPRMHNLLLRRYGAPAEIDGSIPWLMIPDTDEAWNDALESETYHIKPTSGIKEGTDGIDRRAYIVLKGSSQMDADEMAVLIDGLVDECKAVGIETMTPAEINEMIERERNAK